MPSCTGRRTVAIVAVALFVAAQALTTGGAAAGGGSVVTGSQPAPPCTDPADPVTLSSTDQVADLVVGTWIRCEGPSLFDPATADDAEPEVGVEVGSDGRFYRLLEADDGRLLRVEGLDQEGVWDVLDLTAMNGPGSYQLNWTVLGRGTFVTMPTFFESPSAMRLDEMRGAGRYERWTGAPPIAGPPPAAGDDRCPHPTGPLSPSTVEEVEALLLGTWTICGDTSVVGERSGEVGLEFTADGGFHRLVRDEDGAVVRGVGERMEGTWTVHDPEGLGHLQVDLQIEGSGRVITSPVFLGSPPFVRFLAMGLERGADYVRGDPPSQMPDTGGGPTSALLISSMMLVVLGVALRAWSRPGLGANRGRQRES